MAVAGFSTTALCASSTDGGNRAGSTSRQAGGCLPSGALDLMAMVTSRRVQGSCRDVRRDAQLSGPPGSARPAGGRRIEEDDVNAAADTSRPNLSLPEVSGLLPQPSSPAYVVTV